MVLLGSTRTGSAGPAAHAASLPVRLSVYCLLPTAVCRFALLVRAGLLPYLRLPFLRFLLLPAGSHYCTRSAGRAAGCWLRVPLPTVWFPGLYGWLPALLRVPGYLPPR
jgi:hypothetical protein